MLRSGRTIRNNIRNGSIPEPALVHMILKSYSSISPNTPQPRLTPEHQIAPVPEARDPEWEELYRPLPVMFTRSTGRPRNYSRSKQYCNDRNEKLWPDIRCLIVGWYVSKDLLIEAVIPRREQRERTEQEKVTEREEKKPYYTIGAVYAQE